MGLGVYHGQPHDLQSFLKLQMSDIGREQHHPAQYCPVDTGKLCDQQKDNDLMTFDIRTQQ